MPSTTPMASAAPPPAATDQHRTSASEPHQSLLLTSAAAPADQLRPVPDAPRRRGAKPAGRRLRRGRHQAVRRGFWTGGAAWLLDGRAARLLDEPADSHRRGFWTGGARRRRQRGQAKEEKQCGSGGGA